MTVRFVPLFLVLAAAPAPAFAQPADGRIAAEATAGYAAFVDDSAIEHTMVGGSARVHLTPRLSLGPELVYMRGPGEDRDLFITGNVTFDVVPLREARRGTVGAFVVAGGGAMQHQDRFGATTFASWEGAVTGGAGVRAFLTDRIYALAEFRAGWELHYRVNGGVGIKLR